MEISMCVGLIWHAGERPGFLGGTDVLLLAHGDALAAMLPSYEVGLEFTRVSNAPLVYSH